VALTAPQELRWVADVLVLVQQVMMEMLVGIDGDTSTPSPGASFGQLHCTQRYANLSIGTCPVNNFSSLKWQRISFYFYFSFYLFCLISFTSAVLQCYFASDSSN